MIRIAVSILIVLFLYSCKNSSKNENEQTIESEPAYAVLGDMHNARNSIDYGGTYTGVLPCADCQGIETVLTINYDGTYLKRTHYINKEGGVYEYEGKWTWQDCGNIIVLVGLEPPNSYFVSENHVIHLDIHGERITGDLAEYYILEKEL